MKIEAAQDNQEFKNSIANATGVDLDFIGDTFFGIKRRKSVPPVVTSTSKVLKLYTAGTFGGINSGQSIQIPAGQLICEGAAQNGYWKFVNTTDITLLAGDKEKFIDASLILGPYDIIPSDSILTHNFADYTDAANNTLKITNIVAVATGRPEETDTNYRYRINNALKSFVKTNYFGLHEATTDIPGVSDVKLFNASNGGGTFTIYAQSVIPSTSPQLLSDIEMMAVQNIPPWVSYNILGPNYIGLRATLAVTILNVGAIQNKSEVEKQISNAISSYINNVPSRSFYIQELANVAKTANPNVTAATVVSASIFTGQDEFRKVRPLNMADELDQYIYINSNEKLIVEPITGSIIVSLQ
jgi:hypothetical protein